VAANRQKEIEARNLLQKGEEATDIDSIPLAVKGDCYNHYKWLRRAIHEQRLEFPLHHGVQSG
jgi:hypothetical protein